MTDTAEGNNDLPRTVGLRDLLLLSVGGMIGSSVFFYPAFTGQWIGPAAILAWLVAGVGMVAYGGGLSSSTVILSDADPREDHNE